MRGREVEEVRARSLPGRIARVAAVWVIWAVWALGRGEVAHADQIKHPAGFTFELPKLGVAWEQEPRGDLIAVSDESTTLPELQMFVFPVKQEGSLAEIEGRLAAELARPGVSLAGDPVKTVKLGRAAGETIADASARLGTATLNGEQAVFAIVQRKGKSLVLVGVPKPGIFERGASSFRAVVHGLQPARNATADRAPPTATSPSAPAAARTDLPRLPRVVGIRDVTASSTFADRSRKDLYGAWRTVSFAQQFDETVDLYVPVTAWCEGKPDEGVGETVTITLAAATRIDAIKIAAGVWKTAKLFAANNQITALDVTLDGKTTRVVPAAARTWLEVPVGRPVTTLAIKIAEVKKAKMNDSCLSGIELVQGGEAMAPLTGLDSAAAADLPRALAALQTALAAPGRPGLDKLLEFPFVVHDASGFFHGAPAPITHAGWKAVDAACRAADKASERGQVDESRPVSCPRPADVDPADTRPAILVSDGPGKIEITFPSHREVSEVWRLRRRDSAWRLSAIDYQ